MRVRALASNTRTLAYAPSLPYRTSHHHLRLHSTTFVTALFNARPMSSTTKQRKSPSLAADIAVMREREGKRELLMIKRGGRTFHGCLAFPGGFVEYGEEPKHAALRELQEETSLVGTDPQLVGVYGDPARDILSPLPRVVCRVSCERVRCVCRVSCVVVVSLTRVNIRVDTR
jgi:ADP-ribose pyrophosphatase YjhB (NUDIX family)